MKAIYKSQFFLQKYALIAFSAIMQARLKWQTACDDRDARFLF